MFRKRQTDYQYEQSTEICLVSPKQNQKSKKLLRKIEQFNSRFNFEDFIQQSQFLGQFKAPFHIEFFQEQKQLDDNCISNLSNALQVCKPNKNLNIDLTKMWHLDQSDLTDQAVEQFSYCLSKFNKVEQLNLAMHGWGYWNQNITNSSLKYLGQSLWQKDKLSEISIDLNMWAYENQQISDEGAQQLLEGLGGLTQLGKLELNMKGWGDCNTSVTDNTIIAISDCLNKLSNLSEIKLILWDSISKKAMKQLNTTLSKMEHLNQIDLKFESSSTIQRTENHNKNAKLAQIKLNAQQKRKLLFQTEAIVNTLRGMVKITRLWNIAIKL